MALQQLTREDFIILDLSDMQGPRHDIYFYESGADPNDLNPALPGEINQGDAVLITTETNPRISGDIYIWNGSSLDYQNEFFFFTEAPHPNDNLPIGSWVFVFESGYESDVVNFNSVVDDPNDVLGENLFPSYSGVLFYDNGWSYYKEFIKTVLTEEQQAEDLPPNSTGLRTLKVSVADEYYAVISNMLYMPNFSLGKAFLASQSTHEFKFKLLEDQFNQWIQPILFVISDIMTPPSVNFLFIGLNPSSQNPNSLEFSINGFFIDGGPPVQLNETIGSETLKVHEWNHIKITLTENEGNVFLVGESYDYDSEIWVKEFEINLSNEIGESLADSLISSDNAYGFGFTPSTSRNIEGTLLDDYLVTEVNLSTE